MAPTNGQTIESGSNSFFIPEFGYNKAHDASWSYGLTIYGNGGMNTDYATNPVSYYNDGTHGRNQMSSQSPMGVNLEQLIVAPVLSYKVDETQSVGVSPLLVYQNIEVKGIQWFGDAPPAGMGMSSNANALSNKGKSSSTGLGLRLGYFKRLNDQIDLGLSYAPKIKMSKFDEYAGLFNGSFDIPENYTLGLGFKVNSNTRMFFDYQRINYNNVGAIGKPTANLLSGNVLGSANGPGFGWQNINVMKLGVEWRQTAALTLRAGYNHSDNPIGATDVTFNIMAPGVMTKHYTLGGTYELEKDRQVTFAYMYAPESSVTGANLFYQGNDTIRMKQQSFGLQYAWKY
jgi:long-chain fatty acid transport protein